MTHDYLYPLVALSSNFQVIFYDQLDAGASDRLNEPENWRVPRFLAEISAIREHLKLETLSIFGNSWGGTLAVAYAATRPAGLQRVVLSSPLLHVGKWIADNAVYRANLPADVLETLEQCEASGDLDCEAYEAATKVFYKRHLCRLDPWPDYVDRTFELMNNTCYRGMWGPNEFTCNALLSDLDQVSAPGRACGDEGVGYLAQISVPTLITCGEFDEATPSSCREFAKLVPGAECNVFEGASHMTFVEQPEEYLCLMREFFGAA